MYLGRILNLTAPIELSNYPSQITVKSHGEGLYEFSLEFDSAIDARAVHRETGLEVIDTNKLEFVCVVICSGNLIPSIKNAFSCKNVIDLDE